jgi:hypothetical protein
MKFTTLIFAASAATTAAFVPNGPAFTRSSVIVVKGYLDDLSQELYSPDGNPDIVAESHESTDMKKEQLDRFGPGDFSSFVDFNEFNGGDGRK